MKKLAIKNLVASFLLLCSLSVTTLYAETTQEDIDNAREQINEIQNQKDEAEERVDDISDEKAQLEGDLSGLNSQLSGIVGEINDLEDRILDKKQEIADKKQEITDKQQEIADKEQEIADATTRLAETQAEADKQYEDMKIRIQFMYENSDESLWMVLLESESIADFLNRTEYIAEINKYDRKLFTDYQDLLVDISDQKKGLEQDKDELVAMEQELEGQKQELETQQQELEAQQEDMKTKQASVNALIADTREHIAESEENLAAAQDDVAVLEEKLQKMIEYEAELELKKAREDAERLESIKQQEQEDTSGVVYVPEDSDQYLLGAIIQCEAEGEPYEGKLAVGSVVMNRVKSSYFPNTISGVIYQSGQFSPVASGRLAYRLENGVNDTCLQAAQEVLNGNITVNCLYFRRNNGVISGTVIGNHVFY
ncbi:MAG: cell wall hydrolase [Roseburia sp.]